MIQVDGFVLTHNWWPLIINQTTNQVNNGLMMMGSLGYSNAYSNGYSNGLINVNNDWITIY
jgi:hypothetical protein